MSEQLSMLNDEPDWDAMHEGFKRELAIGGEYEERLAKDLRDAGFDAYCYHRPVREKIDGPSQYTGEQDVHVYFPDRTLYIESKAIRVPFTSKDDWPYPWGIYVNTIKSWNAKDQIPFAVVNTSQITGARLVISPRTQEFWTTRTARDSRENRGYKSTWYCCPIDLTTTFDNLIEALRKERDGAERMARG